MIYVAEFKYIGNEREKATAEDKLNNHEIHDEVTRKRLNKEFKEFKINRITWLINRQNKYGKVLLTPNRLLTNHDIVALYKWFETQYDSNNAEIESDFIFEPDEQIIEREFS